MTTAASPRPRTSTLVGADGTRLAWHAHLPAAGADLHGAPPVLLTNGIGTTENFWRHLITALSPNCRVAHWDYRGHGASGLSPTRDYRIEAQADDLGRVSEALMAAGGGTPPIHVAFSMGVAVLLELYRSRPQLVRGMALFAGAPDAPGVGTLLFRAPGSLAAVRLALRSLTPVVPCLAPAARALLRARVMYPTARALGVLRAGAGREDIEQFLEQVAQMDPQAYWLTLRGLMDAHASDVLPRVEVPVLIIAGARDALMRLAQVRRMREGLPHAEYLELPDAGHAGLLEAGPEIAAAVRRLIDRVEAPPSRSPE